MRPDFLFRASWIHNIMGNPRTGTGLSETAKTALRMMAKENVYGFNKVATGKQLEKGTRCEQDSIDLLNAVTFERHVKNTERRRNEFVTGECDIYVPAVKTIDIKSAWTLASFPATIEQVQAVCKDSGYDWQGDVYMQLWDVPAHEVAYCMVSTPVELRRYDQEELHEVDHIDPAMRVTRYTFERSARREAMMLEKIHLAREFLKNEMALIRVDHK